MNNKNITEDTELWNGYEPYISVLNEKNLKVLNDIFQQGTLLIIKKLY
jgi:hypothetical protein